MFVGPSSYLYSLLVASLRRSHSSAGTATGAFKRHMAAAWCVQFLISLVASIIWFIKR